MARINLAAFSPSRILVCQLRQIGDVLLVTPSLELLKRRYPQSELHLLTEKKCTSLLEHNPHIDKLWSLDKQELRPFPKELLWYHRLARTGFDLVVDFQQLPRCRWVVAFSGAPVRLSYTPPWYTRFLYTHFTDTLDGYAAMSKASVLAPLGLHWQGERPRIYLTEEERTAAREQLTALGLHPGQTLITVDPTHRHATRRWPASSYGHLLRLLAESNASFRFLPLWGPGEEQVIEELLRFAPAESMILPDKMLSLREMAATINAARLHVGNCSAPRHIAVAVDTPTYTVLGATSRSWTFPAPEHAAIAEGLTCQPCNKNTCSHIRCLEELTPETVADGIRRHLAALIPYNV